ncbi:branched-chain amino acid ABC transporter substrate-binding protein [Ensifer sp. ENS04]|uniref:branched-chain amino acid ABC transporter substrate-binding protein n=1 Tax=Ensifer sp. ENS04 TaxID=2769281 RepID=UPI001780D674|nr:branched-chain amino acid ABC transporter substrate-binding protein [Ensifer sp. ENS04]MBD9541480.1 branched-chain amino acid ABC transporter substrate-binding protein [Ensifer sp. ENS04]
MCIDVVLPLTGALANFGIQVKQGVEAAVSAVRSSGNDACFTEVRFHDDMCIPAVAVEIAGKIVASGGRLVLGHVCSSTSLAASSIYTRNNVTMLSPASSISALTEQGLSGVFRVSIRDDVHARTAADYLAGEYRDKRIAIVFEDDLTGRAHANQISNLLAARHIAVRVSVPFLPETPNATVDELKSHNVDAVFYGGHFPDQFGLLLRTARRTGFGGNFISNQGANNRKVWDASEGAAEGLVFTFDEDYRLLPGAQKVVANYRAFGIEPAGYTLPAYAAAQICIEASAQDSTGDELREILRTRTFETVIGAISFDPKGDVQGLSSVLYRWSNGNAAPFDSNSFPQAQIS